MTSESGATDPDEAPNLFAEIGNRLRELRERRGKDWTQKRVGEELGGLSDVAVSQWEAGKDIRVSTLRRLCRYYGVSADYLLGLEPPRPTMRVVDEPTLTAVRRAASRPELEALLRIPWGFIVDPSDKLVTQAEWDRIDAEVAAKLAHYPPPRTAHG